MSACETCGDSGVVPIGEHRVSREMALDAGTPELEGSSMGVEYGPCPDCPATLDPMTSWPFPRRER